MLWFLLVCALGAQPAPPAPEYAAAVAGGDERHAAFDAAGARRQYERALEIDPTSVAARARLAHVLGDLGEDARAEADRRERAGTSRSTRRARASESFSGVGTGTAPGFAVGSAVTPPRHERAAT